MKCHHVCTSVDTSYEFEYLFAMTRSQTSSLHRLAVITAWRNRPELLATLNHNAIALRDAASVTVVNCGGNRRRLRSLLQATSIPLVRVVHITARRFNKCLAINLGVAHAT